MDVQIRCDLIAQENNPHSQIRLKQLEKKKKKVDTFVEIKGLNRSNPAQSNKDNHFCFMLSVLTRRILIKKGRSKSLKD